MFRDVLIRYPDGTNEKFRIKDSSEKLLLESAMEQVVIRLIVFSATGVFIGTITVDTAKSCSIFVGEPYAINNGEVA